MTMTRLRRRLVRTAVALDRKTTRIRRARFLSTPLLMTLPLALTLTRRRT
jgi:hypothetical protein